MLYATLFLFLACVAAIMSFAVLRVRAAQKFAAKKWYDVDIFGFESTSSAAFSWASRSTMRTRDVSTSGPFCSSLKTAPEGPAQ